MNNQKFPNFFKALQRYVNANEKEENLVSKTVLFNGIDTQYRFKRNRQSVFQDQPVGVIFHQNVANDAGRVGNFFSETRYTILQTTLRFEYQRAFLMIGDLNISIFSLFKC